MYTVLKVDTYFFHPKIILTLKKMSKSMHLKLFTFKNKDIWVNGGSENKCLLLKLHYCKSLNFKFLSKGEKALQSE